MIKLHQHDKHAPFAHYQVTIPKRSVKIRNTKSGKKNQYSKITRGGESFTICYFCNHWIVRTVYGCKCPASCHIILD